jgi:hypothetical protein
MERPFRDQPPIHDRGELPRKHGVVVNFDSMMPREIGTVHRAAYLLVGEKVITAAECDYFELAAE